MSRHGHALSSESMDEHISTGDRTRELQELGIRPSKVDKLKLKDVSSSSSSSLDSVPSLPVKDGSTSVDDKNAEWQKNASPLRERKKSTSRKLIPRWYDDDDYDESEVGWASVSVVRRRLA